MAAIQPVEAKESDTPNSWPKELLVNKAFAIAFACTKCGEVPTQCMNNQEGHILCSRCAQNVDSAVPNQAVQMLVNKLQTKCMSAKPKKTPNAGGDESAEGNVMDTRASVGVEGGCDWTGMLTEWKQHEMECEYVVVRCTHCKTHSAPRNKMKAHVPHCPDALILCPLNCGASILRKEKEKHIETVCSEKLLVCQHDDCKMEIARKKLDVHMKEECEERPVECPYTDVGCSVKGIKARDLQKHMAEYKMDHILNKLGAVQSENAALKSQLQDQQRQIKQLQDAANERRKTSIVKHITYHTTAETIRCHTEAKKAKPSFVHSGKRVQKGGSNECIMVWSCCNKREKYSAGCTQKQGPTEYYYPCCNADAALADSACKVTFKCCGKSYPNSKGCQTSVEYL